MNDYRVEEDSLGSVRVPSDALYGAQTQRAVENFSISGLRMPRNFIWALGHIKSAAARANAGLGLLRNDIADAVARAAEEVAEGKWDGHFPVDVFQTGSATSTNMNANEVIANRAAQMLGADIGSRKVHPNDHVNLCQSSNDIIPSAIHVSALAQLHSLLFSALSHLHNTLLERARDCRNIVKTGRTHLMDATPVTLGQEIDGWAYQISQSIERIESCCARLSQLAIGGTAVGTGLNAHPDFAKSVIDILNKRTGFSFAEAENHFAAQASPDTILELSGHLKTAASALIKISGDLRLMNSGPAAGLGEISLPDLQPGSSIMPGKVNPVVCESALMACAQVIGNDTTIAICAGMGAFELNTGMPLIAYGILQSITILANAVTMLADKAVAGFTVNESHLSELLWRNPILITGLAPKIGYDRAADIVKRARAEKKSINEIAAEELKMTPNEIEKLIDPLKMTGKGIIGGLL
ncbi:MAG TPA: class II fumarate hydratase [Dissulfurispiraceae bacterium]|nr:class II fumarate hydratase [Dissulfurispiraceae bacterium]